MSSVHPRWRGEHPDEALGERLYDGSSPLARGTQDNPRPCPWCGRFIPAGAGNTSWARLLLPPRPVHPRWRGEHPIRNALDKCDNGSSPLARGTRDADEWEVNYCRFIPAGAGNTASIWDITVKHAVHPRWRGEHSCAMMPQRIGSGSSPLARGTLPDRVAPWECVRFIPAGAGNTYCLMPCPPQMPVHPRWRGEHPGNQEQQAPPGGSSPLARGTLVNGMAHRSHRRFIPAGAGNTSMRCIGSGVLSVHPRWRGEHLLACTKYIRTIGSSPLARGTHWKPSATMRLPRFIPAGAGNTTHPRACERRQPVHPRWRGEHGISPRAPADRSGSSPLARGTPCNAIKRINAMRFIPAGAGNTGERRTLADRDQVHPRWRGEHLLPLIAGFRGGGSSPLARGTR